MPQTIGKGIRSMGLRKIAAIWAAKTAEKLSVHIFHRQGVTWAGKISTEDISADSGGSGIPGEERYFCRVRNKWKNDDQQYALRSAGSRRK